MGLFDEKTGGLVAYWKSVGAITSLVGSQIAPDAAREKWTGSFIVYTRAPGGTVYRHLGGTTGARLSIVHVYCWADTRSGADALAEAVKRNTQGFRGTWSGGVFINSVVVDDPQDDGYEKPLDSSEANKYWSRVVLRITHGEAGGT